MQDLGAAPLSKLCFAQLMAGASLQAQRGFCSIPEGCERVAPALLFCSVQQQLWPSFENG